jgi:hypothetical protein
MDVKERGLDGCGGKNSVARASIDDLKLMHETRLIQQHYYLAFEATTPV